MAKTNAKTPRFRRRVNEPSLMQGNNFVINGNHLIGENISPETS